MIKKITDKQKQKLIYLQWQDAHSNSGWHTKEQLQKEVDTAACIVEEIGWIVYEDDKAIHMISRRILWTIDNSSEYGMYQRIPKTWVLKRKEIKI